MTEPLWLLLGWLGGVVMTLAGVYVGLRLAGRAGGTELPLLRARAPKMEQETTD